MIQLVLLQSYLGTINYVKIGMQSAFLSFKDVDDYNMTLRVIEGNTRGNS